MAGRAKRAVTEVAEPLGEAWELPAHWQWKRIGDLCEYVSRGRSPAYVSEGGVFVVNQRCVRWGGINFEHCKQTSQQAFVKLDQRQHLRAGDIIWNSTGTGTIGRAAIFPKIDGIYVPDSHVTVLRPKSALPSWIERWISTYFVQQRVAGIGSTNQVELSRDTVLNMPIPFVKRSKQIDVVNELDRLISDIEDAEIALYDVRSGLQTYRKSLLNAAITGQLTADWRRMHKPKQTGQHLFQSIVDRRRPRSKLVDYQVNEEDLPALPESWIWCRNDSAGAVQLGRQRTPKDHHGPHMHPYLRVANVYEDHIDTEDVKSMNFTPSEFETFRLSRDDILLNEGQSLELIGRPAMFRGEVEGCCFQNTLVRFRAEDGVDPEYALITFLAAMYAKRFQRIAKITTNIAHLGAGRFSELGFPLAPTEEQYEIVRRYKIHMQMLEDVQGNYLPDSIALRQSLLSAAFRGKLT